MRAARAVGVKNAESREPIKTSTSSYISVRELRLSVPVSRLPFAPEAALAVFSFDMATTDLGSTEDEVPRQLGFLDLPATVHSVYTTRTQQLTKDSLLRYTDGTPVRSLQQDKKTSRWRKILFYILMYPTWANFIRRRKVWGVGKVNALMVWGFAPSQPARPESPLSRLIGAILTRLAGLNGLLDSPEQKKRRKEFAEKSKACVGECLGARVQDMLSVDALLTVREHRRKGYASSLVRTLTEEADRESRAAWLINSSMEANTAFYESLGFKTVHCIVLGDDSPTWTEEPVKLAIMVREAVGEGKQ